MTDEKEIDISYYIKKMVIKKMVIIYFVLCAFVLGILVSFTARKQYKSEAKLLLSINNSQPVSSLLQQFGGLAGINVGNLSSNDIIKPELYPTILESPSFLLKFIKHPVYFSNYDTTVSLEVYYKNFNQKSIVAYIKDYTIGLPRMLRQKIGKKRIDNKKKYLDLIRLNENEKAIIEDLKARIKVEYYPANEVLNVSVELSDPWAATELTKYVVQDLTEYIISYKVQKAKDDFEFIRETCFEAEEKFRKAQAVLALYRDQNKNVISAISKTKEDQLQAEYNLAFNVYNNLSQQLEQAKIKVQEQTPVFKLLGTFEVPTEKSRPKRTIIIFMYSVSGFFFSLVFIFGKDLFVRFRKKVLLDNTN